MFGWNVGEIYLFWTFHTGFPICNFLSKSSPPLNVWLRYFQWWIFSEVEIEDTRYSWRLKNFNASASAINTNVNVNVNVNVNIDIKISINIVSYNIFNSNCQQQKLSTTIDIVNLWVVLIRSRVARNTTTPIVNHRCRPVTIIWGRQS